MYEQRFGLERRPFPTSPDSAGYYPATSHETALALVHRGIDDQESLLLVTGAPGMGKTLVALRLLDEVGSELQTAFLTNSHFPDRASLIQSILYDLDLPYADEREQVLRLRLTEHLLATCRDGKRTLIVVDEAQHLISDHLEELRMLANLEAGKGKAVQVLLVSQPSLLPVLQRSDLASFQQRLAVRATLPPMDLEESFDYLRHHLRQAGGKPEEIFDESALEAIARTCRGIPRLLNQAGHQALTLADAAEMEAVDTEAAHEALMLLGLATEEEVVERDEPPLVAGTIGTATEIATVKSKGKAKKSA